MTKASDNAFPSVLITEGTVPSTPAAGKQRLYIDSTTHVLKVVNSSGTASNVAGASGNVATDAIWDAAGDLAVGSGADTAARLAKGAAGGALSIINTAVAWNSGTSFPGSKATGDRYWRTDLAMEFYWDGTRWLSTQYYQAQITALTIVIPMTVNGSHYGAFDSTGHDLWLTRVVATTQASATNNGSNYWTLVYNSFPSAAAFGSGINTSADTAGVSTGHTASIGAVLTSGDRLLGVTFNKTGGPGSLYLATYVEYQIIAT